MKIIVLLLIATFFYSCKQDVMQTVLSPKDKIIVLPYSDLISNPTTYDTISELNSFTELNNLWLVGTQNGIYIIDKKPKKIIKYFKFELKSNKDLFDGQDSIVGFLTTDLIVNKTKDKLLVITSNGIVFQIDLKKYDIDWLVKFVHRIETATYSDNGLEIAIGTRNDNKIVPNGISSEYYSSLFTISSESGKYIDHFNETANIRKILFNESDTKLLVAYDWSNTDSYLWGMKDKQKCIAKFSEEDSHIYDIAQINGNEFVTVNSKGISLWNIKTSNEKSIVLRKTNRGSGRILENKLTQGYLLIAYSDLIYFDKKLHIMDTLKLPILFEDAQYSSTDSIVILKNLTNNNDPSTQKTDGEVGFYSFNLATNDLTIKVNRQMLNEIIKTNRY